MADINTASTATSSPRIADAWFGPYRITKAHSHGDAAVTVKVAAPSVGTITVTESGSACWRR